MKKLTGLLFVVLVSSCGVYKTKSVISDKPVVYEQHTTRSFPINSGIDESKLSDFEISVINSWDDFTDEQKEFFKKSLITKQKADSLIFNKN